MVNCSLPVFYHGRAAPLQLLWPVQGGLLQLRQAAAPPTGLARSGSGAAAQSRLLAGAVCYRPLLLLL